MSRLNYVKIYDCLVLHENSKGTSLERENRKTKNNQLNLSMNVLKIIARLHRYITTPGPAVDRLRQDLAILARPDDTSSRSLAVRPLHHG